MTAVGSVQAEALKELRAILYSRLRATLFGRISVDDALLDDFAQEALLKVLGSLGQFQSRSRFLTWATTIAVRTAFTELRRRHWKDVSLDQFLQRADTANEQVTKPQCKSDRQELIQEMYRIIDTQLTKKQRTALLAELQGMPLEEIGRRMGSNRNAIYKLTHDARKQLKKHLDSAGYTVSDLQIA